MELNFEIGDPSQPRGHALLYFTDSSNGQVFATYVVLLPITVDVSKYVPPFLMNQVGDTVPGDMSAFAFPPAPEEVDSLEILSELALARNDDLIFAGPYDNSDVTSSMMKVNDVVQAYQDMYEEIFPSTDESLGDDLKLDESPHINDVVYSLMSEADRLGELTKLVGTLRYSMETGEDTLIKDTEADIFALAIYFSETYQINNLLKWAKQKGSSAADITDLYLKRCFHLSKEEYVQLGEVEAKISSLTGT